MIIPNLMPLYSYMKTVWCHLHSEEEERERESGLNQICAVVTAVTADKMSSKINTVVQIFTTTAEVKGLLHVLFWI